MEMEVKLELGHRAKVRDVPSREGHTHDWVIFAKGSDGVELEHFIEKVVFWLHESYEQPKRVIKHAPYRVEQSGFAGFNMLIDVHFRNKEDPKMVRFQYDLFLHTEAMPPVNHTRVEKLTFTNPTEDFRKKLLAAGAILKNRAPGSSRASKTSPVNKKEKVKSSKESSKHRDRSASAGGKDPEETKKSRSIGGKKEGRIAMKDMKHHEESFKHPKTVSSKSRNDPETAEKTDVPHERGRPEKRRSFAIDEDVITKKKKRHSDEFSAKDKAKSQNVSSASIGHSSQKKEKIKIKKIKEKPELMAGLFAPESSINMNHIKQSKEKSKSDEVKIKKEKTSSTTPSREPKQTSEDAMNHPKVSSVGDLTLKIKKEKISSKKTKKSRDSNVEKEGKERKKDISKVKKSLKHSVVPLKELKSSKLKRSHSAVRSNSSSSGSDDDMSNSDSEGAKNNLSEVEKRSTFSESSKSKLKLIAQNKTSQENPEKRKLTETKKESKQRSKLDDKHPGRQEAKIINAVGGKLTQKKPQESSKHKKSGKEDRRSTGASKQDAVPTKTKKQKRSSKDRSRERSLSRKSNGQDKNSSVHLDNTTVTDMVISPISPNVSNFEQHVKNKKVNEDYPTPGASFLEDSASSSLILPTKTSPSKRVSSSKSERKPSPSLKEPKRKHSGQPHKKKNMSRDVAIEKSMKQKKIQKSFIESSSDEESRTILEVSKVRKKSFSSSASEDSTIGHQEDVQIHPAVQDVAHSSSSASSDEEEGDMSVFRGDMSVFPPANNVSPLSVISPIAERPSNPIENEYSMDNAFKDMEMSDSSGDSPFHLNQEENPDENHPDGTSQNDTSLNDYVVDDLKASSSEDEERMSPIEKPFQYQSEEVESQENPQNYKPGGHLPQELPNVIVKVDTERREYPHLTVALYEELQELQRKLSYVTDVKRLQKIASIVAKSQKLRTNPDYFDFDLCSLDHKTIHKIQKQLKAL